MLQVTSRAAPARRASARVDIAAWLLGGVVLVGAALRLRAYAADRSLWLDESFIAVDVIRSSAGALLGTLDFNQGAAPAFLLLEKGLALVDRRELVLRIPALVFSLADLVLLCALVRRRATAVGGAVAAALLALSPAAIYYASELKQYSGDALSTIAVVLAAASFHEQLLPSRRRLAGTALVGLGALALSQSAVFTVAGAGTVLVGAALWERRRAQLRGAVVVVGAWAVAAALALAHTLSTSSGVLQSYGLSSALAAPGGGTGTGGGARLHFASLLVTSVADDLGFPTAGSTTHVSTAVAALLAVAGLVLLLRRGRAVLALLLLAPVVLVAAANAAHHYPISGRTALFVVPIACVFVGEGVAAATLVVRPRVLGIAVAVAAAATVGYHAVRTDARTLRSPVEREEMRALLPRLDAAARPGDRLFVVYSAQYALAYYAECGCGTTPRWRLERAGGGSSQWAPALASTADVTIQPRPPDDATALRRLQRLPAGRTWLLVSHVSDDHEKQFFTGPFQEAFARRGARLRTIAVPGAYAILFDIRRTARSG